MSKKYTPSVYYQGVLAAEAEYKVGLEVICNIHKIEENELTAGHRLGILASLRTCARFDALYFGAEYETGMIDFIDHIERLIKEGLV